MGKLEKYTSYQDSGVEWLGEIPEHWDVRKLRTCLKPLSIKNRPDLPLLSVTREQGVILRDVDDKDSNHNFIPDDLSGYKMVKSGQFAMNKMKAWQGSYGVSNYTGIVSPAYYIFELDGIEPSFFHKAIRSKAYIPFFTQASDGVRIGQWDLSKSRMKEIPLYFPSKSEQIIIVSYIDEKAAQIDNAIGQKEKLIELLKEQKHITINESVTKGLDKDVEFKDSNVEWIGTIPKHWNIEKGKRLFKQMKRPVREQDEIVTCFRDGVVTLRSNRRTEGFTNALKEHGYQGIRKGDFIIHNMDAFAGAIGISDSDGKSTPVYAVCRPWDGNIVSSKYYAKYLRNLALQDFILSLAKGIRERSTDFRFKDFGELVYPLPPKEEQIQIVEYINKQITKIDKAIDLQQNYITKLKEYKASLIDSVVTGKVKVS